MTGSYGIPYDIRINKSSGSDEMQEGVTKVVNLDANEMSQAVEAVLAQVGDNQRWVNAVKKAAVMIEGNQFMHWTGESLLVLSDSGKLYEAAGQCQCKAFAEGFPCKHRAAYRLVKRLNEEAL